MGETTIKPNNSYTRKEVAGFIAEISKKIVDSNTAFFHSMITLNTLLRLPNAEEIFDEELKEQARDLWLKLKSTGLQLTDPPLLFGVPNITSEEKGSDDGSIANFNA